MKSASLSEIKKELSGRSETDLQQLCMRLAKYNKDNKELLHYLLFESENEQAYLDALKVDMDAQFEELNCSNAYLTKKGLRKILKTAGKHIKYSGIAQTEIEALVYFCKKVKASACFKFVLNNSVLNNLYVQQLKKIDKALTTLHEDLQFDYHKDLEEIDLA